MFCEETNLASRWAHTLIFIVILVLLLITIYFIFYFIYLINSRQYNNIIFCYFGYHALSPFTILVIFNPIIIILIMI